MAHTTDGQHARGSFHYVGQAVDLAARSGPGVDTSALLAINEGVVQLLPHALIEELIYAGPGGVCIKNGQIVDGNAVFGAETMAEHHNHVHLAVVPNFSFTASPKPQEAPMSVAVAAAFPYESGYVIVLTTGQVYAFNCTWRGGVHINPDGTVGADLPK